MIFAGTCFQRPIDPLGNIGGLLVERDKDGAVLGVKAESGLV